MTERRLEHYGLVTVWALWGLAVVLYFVIFK